MIRTDKAHQWASTQMAVHNTEPAKWPLEEGRKHSGLDYQSRFPEDEHPPERWDDRSMTFVEVIMWWVAAIKLAAYVVALCLAAYFSWYFVAGFVQAWGRL